jgi:hypothetical protein
MELRDNTFILSSLLSRTERECGGDEEKLGLTEYESNREENGGSLRRGQKGKDNCDRVRKIIRTLNTETEPY